jgi:SAM-dependent methyltransferase
VTGTITVTVELEGTLDEFLAELAAGLSRFGIAFEDGRIVEDGFEVGRVVDREPGERVVFEWHAADWDPEVASRLELRRDGSRVVVEHRGFAAAFWDAREILGWFAHGVAAPMLAASAPTRLGDWLTDRAARRPTGTAQRESYRDPLYHRPSFGAVLEALELGPDDVLLEIGCGGGAFLEQALHTGCTAVAVDHSEEMVEVARELNADAVREGRLTIVQADAARLPFGRDSFTAAATMQVFFFLPDPLAVLRECRRVLRAGGRLAVFTVSEEARGTPAMPEPMASRSRVYTDEELVALAREAGFSAATVTRPDLERHARQACLPDDALPLFSGPNRAGQLLIAS